MAALRFSNRIAERLLVRTRFASPLPFSQRCSARFYSSDDPAPPPLLQKLKADLKTAMRAKDAIRLTAIRSVLAAILNASKTASPVTTDAQLVALLKKAQRSCQDASAEFAAANRQDLVEKEQGQVAVYEEYISQSGVEEVSEEQLRAIVSDAVTALASEAGGKVRFGDVMAKLLAPGGPLDGKNVEKAQVAKVATEAMKGN
ncbi:GatB/YqeY domain-containing protein [Hypoxylon sp. FL1857]|nr:GatB/YqeY domain-containing protein [Hypoxylon sp. FL1857]